MLKKNFELILRYWKFHYALDSINYLHFIHSTFRTVTNICGNHSSFVVNQPEFQPPTGSLPYKSSIYGLTSSFFDYWRIKRDEKPNIYQAYFDLEICRLRIIFIVSHQQVQIDVQNKGKSESCNYKNKKLRILYSKLINAILFFYTED